jgi:hypothetical protein
LPKGASKKFLSLFEIVFPYLSYFTIYFSSRVRGKYHVFNTRMQYDLSLGQRAIS